MSNSDTNDGDAQDNNDGLIDFILNRTRFSSKLRIPIIQLSLTDLYHHRHHLHLRSSPLKRNERRKIETKKKASKLDLN
ncbi:hypothetical protein QR98_0062780 [Sarcoptes scabiei]|uniref:Uncharacterized protein n=1 Tax=Sarcoptes scabiei TaxID=52283 RepID=A0A132A9V8_SARSC|nr:hypothetical protein QR98_0062780 [Sarcoptes scabiei]